MSCGDSLCLVDIACVLSVQTASTIHPSTIIVVVDEIEVRIG